MGAGIDAGDAVEQIGEAHDAGIAHGQGDELLVVGEQTDDLIGEEKEGGGEEGGDGAGQIEAHAHDPVDGVGIALAPVLADEHGGAALQPEDDQLNDEDQDIGLGHGGQGSFAEAAHHKGVDHAQGCGDEILEQDRQGQKEQILVESPPPIQIREHMM